MDNKRIRFTGTRKMGWKNRSDQSCKTGYSEDLAVCYTPGVAEPLHQNIRGCGSFL